VLTIVVVVPMCTPVGRRPHPYGRAYLLDGAMALEAWVQWLAVLASLHRAPARVVTASRAVDSYVFERRLLHERCRSP
jgi:hypothetical protein